MVLRLFFSWQIESDTPKQHNKPFIWECLNAAAGKVQNKGDLKGITIEVEEGVRGVPGTPETINKCFERIDKCHIFVSDMTISERFNWLERAVSKLSRNEHRVGPNSNVITEYSRARAKKGDGQIITVMNTINGSVKEKNELFPIDIRQDRFPIAFTLKKDKQFWRRRGFETIKNNFVEELQAAIVASAKEALRNIDDEMRPFINWETHKRIGDFRGGYADTPDLQELKQQIRDNKGNIRVLGMSGLGKTRLVLESFKSYKEVYWYCDCQNTLVGELKEKLPDIFKRFSNYVLVFDNCDNATSSEIAGLKRSCQGLNPIVTIYNGLEERPDSMYTPLSMQDRYDAVVVEIIDRYKSLFKERDKEKIMEFAGGIPMMAQLLMDGLQANRVLGDVTDENLMSKLIMADEKTDDRKLMQTLSLFDFIGYKNDLRKELEYVVTQKDITNIDKNDDVLLNDIDALIERNIKRRIIEQRGRKIGIRPAPIAFYLVGEWLSACSDERMLRVIKVLQEADCAVALTNAFADQFRNMGFNAKARQMLNNLMGPESPFSSAEVINTRLGSRLFRSFAEVNPVAVAKTLWDALGPIEIERLRSMEEGRRNIVWTLEKLCFDPSSFDLAAKTMMRLAQAENEEIANNATQEFIRLFPVLLPATAVDLDTRLAFLEREFLIEENRPIVLRAIKAALHTRDFIYMGGAEKQGAKTLTNYHPKTSAEIFHYLQGCADMLMSVISPDSKYLDTCVRIVEDDINGLCIFGAANVAIPLFDRIAIIKGHDWDSMLDILHLLKIQTVNPLSPQLLNDIDKRIASLTKKDLVSRFHYVSSMHKWGSSHSWEKQQKEAAQRYEELAEEMVRSKQYDVDVLRSLFSLDNYGVDPFGETIANCIPDDEKMMFFENSLHALSPHSRLGYSIITSFLRVIDEEFYHQAYSLILDNREYRILFSSVATRGYKLNHEYVDQLFQLVEDGTVPVALFHDYWANIRTELKDDDYTYLFGRLAKVDGNRLLVFWMAESLIVQESLKQHPKTTRLLEELVLSTNSSDYAELKSDPYWQLVFYLLEDATRNELASFIHHRILSFIASEKELFISNYNIEKAFSELLGKYFDIVWPELSGALSSSDYWVSFQLQHILGDRISNTVMSPSLLFGQDHSIDLIEWCKKDPQKNAPILIGMAPIVGAREDVFSPLVMTLIDKFGDIQQVLDSLSVNMGSFSYVGSVVPLYESHIRLLQGLTTHPIERVRLWAAKMIAGYELMLEHERNYEAEQDFHIRETSS